MKSMQTGTEERALWSMPRSWACTCWPPTHPPQSQPPQFSERAPLHEQERRRGAQPCHLADRAWRPLARPRVWARGSGRNPCRPPACRCGAQVTGTRATLRRPGAAAPYGSVRGGARAAAGGGAARGAGASARRCSPLSDSEWQPLCGLRLPGGQLPGEPGPARG